MHLEKVFQKFEKLKFYPKIIKTGVIKNDNHYPINSVQYAAAYFQTLEEIPDPLVLEKNSKTVKKMQIIKKMRY